MKRMLMVLLGLVLVLSMTGAVAATEVTVDGDTNVTVKLNLTETYTVQIPTGDQIPSVAGKIDYVNVTKLQINEENRLNITVKSKERYSMVLGSSDIFWKLAVSGVAEGEAAYQRSNTPTDGMFKLITMVSAGKQIDPVTGNYESKTLTFLTTDDWINAAKFAGTHLDVLTFRTAVESIA